MIPYRLAAGPHRFDDLDVEQEHANRDDKIAHSDWHAAVKDRRHRHLGHKGYLEDHTFLLTGERHIEEKNNHVEERKRDEQQGESDQVHASWLSSRKICKATPADDFQRATIAIRATCKRESDLFLGVKHLAAAVHADLEVDVVRPAQLARILILYISRPRERISGAAHSAPRRRCLAVGDGHGRTPGFLAGLEAN